MKVCSVDGCGLTHHAKGLCDKHYKAGWEKQNAVRLKEKKSKYHIVNRELILEKQGIYYSKNKERAKARFNSWVENNREHYNAHQALWRKSNPEKHAAKEARRRSQKFSATPAWANQFFIQEIYHLARARTKVTGLQWQVDHIVPLKSKLVCGLHVENNLQVITASQNVSKRNTHWPDMPT